MPATVSITHLPLNESPSIVNILCERMHRTLGTTGRAQLVENPNSPGDG